MKKTYKQLNKEAQEDGYSTFENRLLQNTFEGNEKAVDLLLASASYNALKAVLVDLIDTLGEGDEWYSKKLVAKIAKLATKIVEERL